MKGQWVGSQEETKCHDVCVPGGRCLIQPLQTLAAVMDDAGKQAGVQRAAEAAGESQRFLRKTDHGVGPRHGATGGTHGTAHT